MNRLLVVCALLGGMLSYPFTVALAAEGSGGSIVLEETLQSVHTDRRVLVIGDMEFSMASRVLVNGVSMASEQALGRLPQGANVRITTSFGDSVAARQIREIEF